MPLLDDVLPEPPADGGAGDRWPAVGAAARRARSARADAWLRALWEASRLPAEGVALLAVGGYGRGELAPGSDLDLLLVHAPHVAAGVVAEGAKALWYPLWDSGAAIDHSVRGVADVHRVAADDLAVALGLLDARPLAGDAELARSVVSRVLAEWRARAPRRLGPLRGTCAERAARSGDVAFALEPDLKEGRGGLRDAAVLRAVAASWVTDRPHGRVDAAAALLADVRDALHVVARRPTERLVRELQPAVAAALRESDVSGLSGPGGLGARAGVAGLEGGSGVDELRRAVAAAGRDLAHGLDGMWRRAIPRPDGRRPRRVLVPARVPRERLATGVEVLGGEVVLGRDARLDDPVLPVRLAAAAAQSGRLPAPATVEVLAGFPPLPEPWPRPAREALLALLGSGPALVPVWEELDRAGIVQRWLPEWEPVRSLPQTSPVHRWTVDRHSIEAAAQAGASTRRVARPDLLLLAALLHDLGKAAAGVEHADAGVGPALSVARRIGLDDEAASALATLVRHHLLLPHTATRRDLDDPATLAAVLEVADSPELLDLLHALTEADARATGLAAWTPWRSSLVGELVGRAHAALRGVVAHRPPGDSIVPEELRQLATAGGPSVTLQATEEGARVVVVAPDRDGLLATVAGVLALHRLAVRAAVVATVDGTAVQDWQVEPELGDRPDGVALRESLRRALDGRLDVAARLAARDAAYRARLEPPPPRVQVADGASADATVLEVRAHDAPGLLHRVAAAVAGAGAAVRSARVATWGAEAVDVLYLVGPDGAPLPAHRAEAVTAAVAAALEAMPARTR